VRGGGGRGGGGEPLGSSKSLLQAYMCHKPNNDTLKCLMMNKFDIWVSINSHVLKFLMLIHSKQRVVGC